MTMKHSVELKCLKCIGVLFNFKGHGFVMAGNRKMTGCFQTFSGHCVLEPWHLHLFYKRNASFEIARTHFALLCNMMFCCSPKRCTKKYLHKRAQRVMGRSPEEKVKGYSAAIYRGTLMLYTKYQGSSRFFQDL